MARRQSVRFMSTKPFLRGLLGLLALVCVPVAVSPARAQALTVPEALAEVSSEAHVVVVVPNLARTSERLSLLKDRYDLTAPHLDDLLTNFKREAGMVGVRDDGTCLLVLENLDRTIEQGEPPTVYALLPVNDYAAFVQGYDGDPDQTVSELTLPQHTGYVRQLGRHALLGKDRQAVADYAPLGDAGEVGRRLGDAGRRYLTQADATVYVDVERLRAPLTAKLDEAEQSFKRFAAESGQPVAMPEHVMQLFMAGARGALADTTSISLALELGEHGIALTPTLRFQPGSALGSLFLGQQRETAPQLARLPDEPYIFAAAMDNDAFAMSTLLQRALNTLGGDVAVQPLAKLIRDVRPLVQQTRATARVQYVPTEQTMMSGNPFPGLTLYATDNPQQYREQVQAYFQSLHNVSLSLGGGQSMTFTSSYVQGALRVDGFEIDQYIYQVDVPDSAGVGGGAGAPDAPAAGGRAGGDGSAGATQQTQGYLAATDEHVIITTRPDMQLIRRALQSVTEEAGIGSAAQSEAEAAEETTTNRRGNRRSRPSDEAAQPTGPRTIAEFRPVALPINTVAEGYLSLAGLGRTVKVMMPMFDDGSFEVPGDLPPVIMGLGIEGDSVAGRLYLPHRTGQFVMNAGRNIVMPLLGPAPSPTEGRHADGR